VRVWTEIDWLEVAQTGEGLVKIFWYQKMRGISWPIEWLSASEKGLFIHGVSYL